MEERAKLFDQGGIKRICSLLGTWFGFFVTHFLSDNYSIGEGLLRCEILIVDLLDNQQLCEVRHWVCFIYACVACNVNRVLWVPELRRFIFGPSSG